MKKEKAITLISLVITIIVLIILASVAIYLSLGNNGVFTRAKQAKEATNKQEATEIINLKITTAQLNKYAEKQEMPTLKELSLTLKDDNEIEYVTQTSKVASTEYNVPSEEPTMIYTKLNKYPYEFAINDKLQLASINGIKVGDKNNSKLKRVSLGESSGTSLTRTFDAKTIPNYKELTVDNFVAYCNRLGCGAAASTNCWTNFDGYGDTTYNNETGIFTININVRFQTYAVWDGMNIKCECFYIE